MNYPNSDLAAWQLALIAIVVLTSLAAWLVLVYAAARQPRRPAADVKSAPPRLTSTPLGQRPAERERDDAKAA